MPGRGLWDEGKKDRGFSVEEGGGPSLKYRLRLSEGPWTRDEVDGGKDERFDQVGGKL